ncbi:hypothetical protein F5884DRAFT_806472 [Xylogone sp. PMI_703]|nr:hypothetical protein F5884DRAFT_806472 [Xylogone sp. PMI_703]
MRDIAVLRKLRGSYGKCNLLQVPDWASADDGLIPPSPLEGAPDRTITEDSRVTHDPSPFQSVTAIVTGEADQGYHPNTTRGESVSFHANRITYIGRPRDQDSRSSTARKNHFQGYQDEFLEHYSQQSRIEVIYLNQPIPLNIRNSVELAILSPLTTLHISQNIIGYFFTKPSSLNTISHYENWSYLRELPRRYGYSACLDSAIDCVAERIRESFLLVATPPKSNSRALYIKALQSLRLSLSTPKNCITAETLCASELLVLWELLNEPATQAYIQHAEGVSRLFQYRKPENFRTEFEKLLFLGRAGSIITEALISNSYCFLQEDLWQEVFRSVVIRGARFSDRSEMVVSLFIRMSYLPDLFKACSEVILGIAVCSEVSVKALACRINSHRAELLEWYNRWESDLHLILSHVSEDAISKQGQSIDSCDYYKCREVCGSYMSCLILDNRFLTALGLDQNFMLELQTFDLSHKIMKLHNDAYSTSPQGGLFMTYTVQIAQATLITTEEWRRTSRDGAVTGREWEGRFIEEETFKRWNALLGRIL